MAVKFSRLITVFMFAIFILLLVVERLSYKDSGYWGANEFGSVAATVQAHAKIQINKNIQPKIMRTASAEYSYIDELWGCARVACIASIPHLFYWYYYWYL